ncbi:MAG TPA: ABC transporter permease, partial [Acidobacteriota bacterium]|nr:ABC transporter permease [Acidobacteriota bacterium]
MKPAGAGERIYRRLLRLFPKPFRQQYQESLVDAFRAQRSESRYRGLLGWARFWGEVTIDLTKTALRLRLLGDRRALSAPRRGGSIPSVQCENAGPWWTRWVSGWTRDFRFSARSLRKAAGFTAVSVITLALGIGATTAIFSLVYSVLLRPLPYDRPDELVLFWEYDPRYQFDHLPLSPAQYLDWKREAEPFSAMAGFRSTSVTLTGGQAQAERLRAMYVDGDLFDVLGVASYRGRQLRAQDCLPGAAPVVVMGYGLWQSRYGGDPGIVGSAIDIDATPHEVVGVLPPGVRFPPPVNLLGQLYEWQTQLYLPFVPDTDRRASRSVMAVARLKSGVSVDLALQQLQPLARELASRHSEIAEGVRPVLVPLREQAVQESRGGLLMILAAVGVLLLIACVNVANLQLARLPARTREIAVLSALGASRPQVLRRLLTESLLVAVIGSLLGIGLAWTGLQSLSGLARNYVPDMGPVQLNAPVLLVALLAGGLTGIVFGMAPGLRAMRLDLTRSLNQGGRSASGGQQRLRSGLVVAEIALAVVLCIGTGLLFNSFLRMQSIDPGFNAQQATALQFLLPKGRYPESAQIEQLQSRVLAETRAVPWVEQSAISSTLPLIGVGNSGAGHFLAEGQALEEAQQAQQVAETRYVSDGFFQVLEIPLLSGRAFESADLGEERPVCIVNRQLAERMWPGQSPLGRRIGISVTEGEVPWLEVVGVAENFKSG